jgi:hypothetical protein
MSHTEISVSPENQRQAAANHKAIGHELNGAATIFDDAVEWGQGLGPIFKEWFAALSELIEDRRAFYTDEAEEHHRLGTGLSNAADMWDANEAQAAKDIGSVS